MHQLQPPQSFMPLNLASTHEHQQVSPAQATPPTPLEASISSNPPYTQSTPPGTPEPPAPAQRTHPLPQLKVPHPNDPLLPCPPVNLRHPAPFLQPRANHTFIHSRPANRTNVSKPAISCFRSKCASKIASTSTAVPALKSDPANALYERCHLFCNWLSMITWCAGRVPPIRPPKRKWIPSARPSRWRWACA
ncbi:hypothetical protein ASPACDRAFT_127999 [Aspergillus aculeatus ATCC 16872]|uniref:Uncharacterized protein n=1 Tax=Aspergillus aculeatus (strain ATCC 16872 / CBS 172.66 / WB 5094) TaxID=690307 RepID=A0A1L9WF82_ASPA1|nr:uncharacterized protein ASPACDRAFT_127999 [Aspergillus aculeatus ATCC 16872]OJJ94828.1 hypothetical protein ASPACDRAFT_127999 [Aspergillus aculeatus ATCC 16872]